MRTTLAVLLPWWNASRPGAARLAAAAPAPTCRPRDPAGGDHLPRPVPSRKSNTVDIWIPSVSNVGHGSEAAARGAGRAEPVGRARGGPPRVPGPGLRRRHGGRDRRGGGLLQG